MIHQLKQIKAHVLYLLTKYPHLRDDDNKLIANIWHSKIGAQQANEITAFTFLDNFAKGFYVSPEAIRRTRQKIQEQNPALQGKSYKKRKRKGTETRKQIHTV